MTGLECGMSLDGREELEGHIDGPAAPTAQRRVDRRLALPAEKCDVSPGEGGGANAAAGSSSSNSRQWRMANGEMLAAVALGAAQGWRRWHARRGRCIRHVGGGL